MTAPIGRSLHIGVNRVSNAHYAGYSGDLVGCENDARFMAHVASMRRFTIVNTLLGSAATSTAVRNEIKAAAASLGAGSFFLLTFAGHGSQMENDDNYEIERFDQTWALYDRQLIDDELSALWPTFDYGVRILVIVDACHSGTPLTHLERFRDEAKLAPPRVRALPREVAKATYRKHREKTYDPIRASLTMPETNDISASVLSITACEDFELAADGDPHGLFTGVLRKLWKQGGFQGTHQNLLQLITGKLKDEPQHPTWQHAGNLNVDFWQGEAFTI